VVISIHRGRSHVPLSMIDGLVDLRQLPVELKLPRPQDIPDLLSADDFEFAIVPPPVGIADLVGHCMQLLNSTRLGAGTHPWQRIDILRHCSFNFSHHLESLPFGLAAEIFVDISLSQRLAKIVVYILRAALPPRLNLFRTRENPSMEIKICID